MRKVKGGSCKNSSVYRSMLAIARAVPFFCLVCDKPDAKFKRLAEYASLKWYQ